MVFVDDWLDHFRGIDLNEPLCWTTIAHAASQLPYDATEDIVVLAAPYDFTCAVLVTHRSELCSFCLLIDWL